MLTAIIIVVVVVAAVAIALTASSVRVLREYERGVVFRLGRLMDQKGPGMVLLLPTIDRMVKVGLRTVTLAVPPQEVITRDNVPVRVTAVAYYRVIDPRRAVTEVENYHGATLQIAQTTLRSVLGGADLDTLLAERDRLNDALQHVIDAQTEPWGIKVTNVEIRDVEIPERMQHAIARQAEAERERRAKIINAEGELQAASALAEAAEVIAANPVTIQLRYLQTLKEIGSTQNSTVVFPVPVDLLGQAFGSLGAAGSRERGDRAQELVARTPAGAVEQPPAGAALDPSRGNGDGGALPPPASQSSPALQSPPASQSSPAERPPRAERLAPLSPGEEPAPLRPDGGV